MNFNEELNKRFEEQTKFYEKYPKACEAFVTLNKLAGQYPNEVMKLITTPEETDAQEGQHICGWKAHISCQIYFWPAVDKKLAKGILNEIKAMGYISPDQKIELKRNPFSPNKAWCATFAVFVEDTMNEEIIEQLAEATDKQQYFVKPANTTEWTACENVEELCDEICIEYDTHDVTEFDIKGIGPELLKQLEAYPMYNARAEYCKFNFV